MKRVHFSEEIKVFTYCYNDTKFDSAASNHTNIAVDQTSHVPNMKDVKVTIHDIPNEWDWKIPETNSCGILHCSQLRRLQCKLCNPKDFHKW